MMSYPANKYCSKCNRCLKELKPGEGFVVKRNKGYEIICSGECLHKQNNLKIEARVNTPPVTALYKLGPYWRKAEFAVIAKMKEIFKDKHWAKIRSGKYNLKRGQDVDENGNTYCFVRATITSVMNKNKKEIIFNV